MNEFFDLDALEAEVLDEGDDTYYSQEFVLDLIERLRQEMSR